jgi:iron complex transport system substrate-binding protein
MRIVRATIALMLLSLLAACSATASSQGDAAPTAGSEWTYTTGFGRTVTLPSAPKVIVADAYSAASLWPYGVRPAGVFGYGLEKDAAPGALGEADVSTMTVVGTGGDLDVEALAALQPDLIIGYGSSDTKGASWTWWEPAVTEKVAKIAPFVGINFADRAVTDVIGEYGGLAKALGGDLDSASVTAAEDEFTAATDTLRTTAAAKSELSAIALNGDTATLWVGGPKLAQIGLLNELGLKTVGPEGEDNAYWGELSWEKVPDYQADVVLAYTASEKAFASAPVYQKLPAVEAGQVIGWDDKMPFTYAQYAAWLKSVNTSLTAAKAVTD